MLIAATRNRNDHRVFQYLLRQSVPASVLDRKVCLYMAGNQSKGLGIMRVLLDHCGRDTYMAKGTLEGVASNIGQGLGIPKLILQKQQAGFVVTGAVLDNAAVFNRKEMLELLINNGGSTTQIA